jgi:putative sterol carrier protein
MATYADAAEVHRYVGGIFEQVLAAGPLGDKLCATGMVLRLHFTDPDATITLDLAGRQVHEGETAADPDAVLTMSGEDANRFWQGKMNLMSALAGRKIKVEGKIASLVKLQPSVQPLFAVYSDMLRANGRSDLLSP